MFRVVERGVPCALFLSLILSGCSVFSQETAPGKDPIQIERDAFIGNWRLTFFQNQPVNEAGKQSALVFTNESLDIDGEAFRYDIDPSKEPKHINILMKVGSAEISFPGIYECNGDDLKLCVAKAEPTKSGALPVPEKRPSRFEAKQAYFWVAKRATPPKRPLATIGIPKTGWYLNQGVAAITPDSSTGVFQLGDYFVLWDLQENRMTGRARLPMGTPFRNTQVRFSPDGKMLTYITEDGTVVYDWLNQKRIKVLEPVSVAAFTPDSRFLMTGGQKNEEVQLWNVSTWESVHTFPTVEESYYGGPAELLASPNGKFLAILSSGEDHLSLWSTKPFQEIRKLHVKNEDGFSSLRFLSISADSTLVAALAEYPHKICVWDIQSGELVREIQPHSNPRFVSFIGNTYQVATTYEHQNGVHIWDVDTGKSIATHSCTEVRNLAVSPDGQYILTSNQDGGSIISLDPNDKRTPVVYPDQPTRNQLQIIEQMDQLNLLWQELDLPEERGDFRDGTGRSLLSWRVRSTQRNAKRLFDSFDRSAPYDSKNNRRNSAFSKMPFWLTAPARPRCVWQFAIGPGTLDPSDLDVFQKVKRAEEKIRLVHAPLSEGVPWTAPHDHVVNPADPWEGLPRDGFFARFYRSGLRFVSGDTPAAELRKMFDATSEVPVDMSFAEGPYDRLLFPNEKKPCVIQREPSSGEAVRPKPVDATSMNRDTTTAPSESARPSNVRIVQAKFGYNNKWVDVTDKIQAAFESNNGEFMNSRKGLGAMKLSSKKKKRLVIKFEVDGVAKSVSIKENGKKKTRLYKHLK